MTAAFALDAAEAAAWADTVSKDDHDGEPVTLHNFGYDDDELSDCLVELVKNALDEYAVIAVPDGVQVRVRATGVRVVLSLTSDDLDVEIATSPLYLPDDFGFDLADLPTGPDLVVRVLDRAVGHLNRLVPYLRAAQAV